MNKIKIIALAVSVSTASAAFGSNLILNGSFEADGGVGLSIGTTADSSLISNWTLQTTSSSSAFFVFAAPGVNEPNPADGGFLLNIGGFGTDKGVGTLWQDFATTPGQTYDVGFFFGRNNNDPDGTAVVSVQASLFDIVDGVPSGGALSLFDSGNAPTTGEIGNLTPMNFQFTATGNTSRLLFADTSTSTIFSLNFDAVSVVAGAAVPEPSSAILAVCSGAILLLRRRWASF